MRFLIFISACLLFNNLGFGKEKQSLQQMLTALSSQKEDSNKVNLYYKISYRFLESKLDSCQYYDQEGLALAKKIEFKRKIPYFYDILGYVNLYKGNFDSAIVCHFEALKLHEKNSDPSGIAVSYNGIGFVHDLQGNSDKALEYYTKSLRIGEEFNNEGLIANCLKFIGSIYRTKEDYKNAIIYLNRASRYFIKMNMEMEKADIFMHLAACYLQTDLDSCYKYTQLSLSYFNSVNDQLSRRADALLIMAHQFQASKNADSAIKYYQLSFGTLEKLGGGDNNQSIYLGLSKSFAMKNNFEMAYHYSQKAYTYLDSTLKTNHVQELEGKYIKQKEEELRSVSEELKSQMERNKRILLWSGLAILALLSVFMILRYRSKSKSNKQLSEKNKLIEEKQQEIIASIRYAQRIQKAHLPSEKRIKSLFEKLKK